MKRLLIKELPKYGCLCEAAEAIPSLKPEAMEAYLHILRASDEVYHSTSRQLIQHGVSKGGFMIMMHLFKPIHSQVESLTPGELADLCGVKRATVTGLVDTLTKEHLVERERDSENRRQVKIALSDKGEKLMAKIVPEHCKMVKDIMSGLTDEETRHLVSLLSKIQGTLPKTEIAEQANPGSAH